MQHAAERCVVMNYDAEQFNIQPAIDALVLDSMRRFNQTSAVVLNTYQCYLKVRNFVLETVDFVVGLNACLLK